MIAPLTSPLPRNSARRLISARRSSPERERHLDLDVLVHAVSEDLGQRSVEALQSLLE